MAREDRPSPLAVGDSITDALLTEGHRYAFFQALRLIRLRAPDDIALRNNVRVRPAVTLSFPETDIDSIKLDHAGKFSITANFFGLYGVTSPLPTFYTEDLIEEQLQGSSSMRDFLDILHASLYPLLFRAWEKNRLWLTIGERHDTNRLDQLFALVGLSGCMPQHTADARLLLPHAGNFSQFPRSALGLQALVAGLLGGMPVEVEPCIPETVAIPEAGRCLLGEHACQLGEDALLGRLITERSGSLVVHIGPIGRDQLHSLLPGSPLHERLARSVALYVRTPLRSAMAPAWAKAGSNWAGIPGCPNRMRITLGRAMTKFSCRSISIRPAFMKEHCNDAGRTQAAIRPSEPGLHGCARGRRGADAGAQPLRNQHRTHVAPHARRPILRCI
jgi:type VI secretion system protein ImpH